jgi:hypothetical protein
MDRDRLDAWLEGYERAWRAADTAAAVEWWATTLEEEQPATLIGSSVLTFTADGQVATGRDYWFLEPGTHHPFEGWGR